MDILCWLLLAIALVIGTFGFSIFITFAVALSVFTVGALISLRWNFSSESDHLWFSLHRSHLPLSSPPFFKLTDSSIQPNKEGGKGDKRITGSNLIDDQLHIVIKYFLRDFIVPWYSEISSDTKFVMQMQQGLQQSLVNISNRFKVTDWVGYLTTRLVEDVASHLRLFRESKASWKSNKGTPSRDLIDHFFDKETEMEKDICRDSICLKPDAEKDYVSDLVEVILFFSLPSDEFANMPVRTALTEMIVASLVMPLFSRLSEPDYINSLIVWACTDIPISSELFLSVIKSSVDFEELESVRNSVSKEINQLRSRDSGGRDEGTEVKQQIGSLEYLRQVIDTRVNRLGKGPETDSMEYILRCSQYKLEEKKVNCTLPISAFSFTSTPVVAGFYELSVPGLPLNLDYRDIARGKLFQLPMEVILKNSLTLDHLLNYMASIDCQHYVNLYLNIECWKTSVSERLCALELERIHNLQQEGDLLTMPGVCHDHFSPHDLSAHKAEADVIYEQYLSEKANPRVQIDDSIVKRLILRLRSEKLNENWFDETQEALFNILKDTDMFLPAFRRSIWYIRLLAELDLLKDISRSDEEDSQSLDDVSFSCLYQNESLTSSRSHSPLSSLNPSPSHTRTPSLTPHPYSLTAHITGTEIVREGNRSHAVYRVSVLKKDSNAQEDYWHVFRRYSEFYDFHISISSKFLDLSSIPFPSKKMLNNLAAWFLEKRMNELNEWLGNILQPPTLQSHPGLQDMIFKFLDHTPYQSSQMQGNIVKRVEENLVAPIRVGVKNVSSAVKAVPDTVLNTVDGVVDGLCRKFAKHTPAGARYPVNNSLDIPQKTSIDLEGEENIPLRIVLLLMDEVFDLRSKDQWFRRRIVLFLRQILKAMFGDIVNRRIVEFVEFITSPEQVAQYIKLFKESIWPDGILAPQEMLREKDVTLRTKVAAKTCMLASISDEFKAILGSQTTYRGVLNVYECVQWKPLNKRLIYVLLSGILEAVFSSQKQLHTILRALNSGSSRVSSRNNPSSSRRSTKFTSDNR